MARWLPPGVYAAHGGGRLGRHPARFFSLDHTQGQYKHLMDFVAAAPKAGASAGMGEMSQWIAVGKTLPKKAKVLIHGMHEHLGIGRPTVSDWSRTQTGISYGRMSSAAAMYEQMRTMGVTHFVWKWHTWPDSSISGDLRFYEFVAKYAEATAIVDLFVGRMPAAPPHESGEELIAFFACKDSYKPGVQWRDRHRGTSSSHQVPGVQSHMRVHVAGDGGRRLRDH